MAPSSSSALPPGEVTRGCTSIHFGENQLSPRSIGISPLSTAHPPVLQHGWVRASTAGQSRFTLAMDSSRGFGSHPRHPASALFRLGCPVAAPHWGGLTRRHGCTRRIILQKARHQPYPPREEGEWPLTAGEYVVSGSISSPSRGAFHLSLTVLVHYRSLKVFSLGGWSPQFPTRFHVPRGTQEPTTVLSVARYGTLTRSGRAFQHVRVGERAAGWLVLQPQSDGRQAGLGCSRFARHYYGNLG